MRRSERPKVTLQRLREAFRYDPETGEFICLIARNKVRVGQVIGGVNAVGYIQVTIDWKIYLAHRLAWFYMTGEWVKEIDHRDLDKTNNRWSNLRESTRTQNNANRSRASNNTSGFKNVSRIGKRWRAYIVVEGKQRHLGCRATPEEAHNLAVTAAKEHYGDFSRAN